MFKQILSAGRGRATGAAAPLRTRRPVRIAGVTAAAAAVTMLAAGPAAAVTVTPVSTGETNPLGMLQLVGGDGATHLWVSDHLNGLCRADNVGGTLVENQASCVLFFGRGALKPGQLSYDPATNYIYVPDLSAKSLGVLRLGYDPTLSNGAGGISLFDRTQLVSNCGSVAGALPWGSALGPEGDLYLVGKKSPNILRIHNPSSVGGVSGNCGADVQNVGNVADGKKGFQLAFVGRNLWEIDGFAFGVVQGAVDAARPQGTTIVEGGVPKTFASSTPPRNALTALVGAVPAATSLTADGNVLYAGNANSVFAINVVNGGTPALVSGGFAFTTAIIKDATAGPGNLYVADDTSNGTFNNAGRIWHVAP